MTSRIAQCQSNLVSSRYRPRGKNFKATYGDPRSLEADLPLYHGAIGDRGVGKSKGISCIDTQVIDIQGIMADGVAAGLVRRIVHNRPKNRRLYKYLEIEVLLTIRLCPKQSRSIC